MQKVTIITEEIRRKLYALSGKVDPRRFFDTKQGGYAEHDQFMNVAVPNVRLVAKEYKDVPLRDLKPLICSPINQERLLALFIAAAQYQKGNEIQKKMIYDWYRDHMHYVNNWNLVDASAHLIVGAHLMHADRSFLDELAKSDSLWNRRIAIVATWYFIRQGDVSSTIHIAAILLKDTHDLIHKAVGWMLREVGKKDHAQLINFLNIHAQSMPRTMLRYAIERCSAEEKVLYMNVKEK